MGDKNEPWDNHQWWVCLEKNNAGIYDITLRYSAIKEGGGIYKWSRCHPLSHSRSCLIRGHVWKWCGHLSSPVLCSCGSQLIKYSLPPPSESWLTASGREEQSFLFFLCGKKIRKADPARERSQSQICRICQLLRMSKAVKYDDQRATLSHWGHSHYS